MIILVALIGIALISSSIPMDKKEAEELLAQAKKALPDKISTEAIFLNNFRATLLMVIPGIGAVLAGVIIYNTGVVFGATGVTHNIPGPLLIIAVALTPFFWLEFLAYSAGVTESLYLLRGIIKKSFRGELRRAGFTVLIAAIFLLLGAAIEIVFIQPR